MQLRERDGKATNRTTVEVLANLVVTRVQRCDRVQDHVLVNVPINSQSNLIYFISCWFTLIGAVNKGLRAVKTIVGQLNFPIVDA